MKCKNCGKDITFPNRVYLNLENYNTGGSVLAASKCCNKGYTIKMEVSYSITEYTGNAKEDDWGVELNKD